MYAHTALLHACFVLYFIYHVSESDAIIRKAKNQTILLQHMHSVGFLAGKSQTLKSLEHCSFFNLMLSCRLGRRDIDTLFLNWKLPYCLMLRDERNFVWKLKAERWGVEVRGSLLQLENGTFVSYALGGFLKVLSFYDNHNYKWCAFSKDSQIFVSESFKLKVSSKLLKAEIIKTHL